jgi:uncharacterized membrane protein HdeD (DUF308 family)
VGILIDQRGDHSVANTTVVFGTILILLGVGAFAWTWAPTALIASYFGLALAICGFIARKERLRMHVMHAAVLIGLVGFAVPAIRAFPQLPALFSEGVNAHKAILVQTIMAAICAVFTALCVKSFIDIRRARKANAAPGA